LDGRVARGFATEQVEGIGTMAGPPARVRISGRRAGRALVKVEIAAIESRVVVAEVNIFDLLRTRYGSEQRLNPIVVWTGERSRTYERRDGFELLRRP
jgi:hypothetical protein